MHNPLLFEPLHGGDGGGGSSSPTLGILIILLTGGVQLTGRVSLAALVVGLVASSPLLDYILAVEA